MPVIDPISLPDLSWVLFISVKYKAKDSVYLVWPSSGEECLQLKAVNVSGPMMFCWHRYRFFGFQNFTFQNDKMLPTRIVKIMIQVKEDYGWLLQWQLLRCFSVCCQVVLSFFLFFKAATKCLVLIFLCCSVTTLLAFSTPLSLSLLHFILQRFLDASIFRLCCV